MYKFILLFIFCLSCAQSAVINLCHCNEDQLYVDDGMCLEDNRTTIRDNFDSTSTFQTNDIECDVDLIIFEMPMERFDIRPNGVLQLFSIAKTVTVDKYCAISKLEGDEEINTYVKACLPAPTIPRCCPKYNQTAEVEEGTEFVSCVNSTSSVKEMYTPITLDDYVNHAKNIKTFGSTIGCTGEQKLVKTPVSMNDEGTYLEYSNTGAQLNFANEFGRTNILQSFQYCLDETNEEGLSAYFCYESPVDIHERTCEGNNCVRKCCKENEVFNMEQDKGCFTVPGESREAIPFLSNISVVANHTTVYGFPLCEKFYKLPEEESFTLLPSGSIEVDGHGEAYTPAEYCADHFPFEGGYGVVLCFKKQNPCFWNRVIQLVALSISCLFILATLFVYLTVKELLYWLLCRCVVAESLSLLVSFVCLIWFYASEMIYEDHICSNVFKVVFYYSTLAAFFWLNVMCFDIYYTVKSLKPVSESTGQKNMRFALYSLYGWGVPLIFTIVACVIGNLEDTPENSHLIRSNIFTSCLLPGTDDVARWIYLYGPISVILVVNLILFILVAITLISQRKINTTNQNFLQYKNHAKQSALLCLKLFFVMGLTWIAEVFSFAIGDYCDWCASVAVVSSGCIVLLLVFYSVKKTSETTSQPFETTVTDVKKNTENFSNNSLIVDLINSLRGLFMFLIFVCNRNVLDMFKYSWGQRLGKKQPQDDDKMIESEKANPVFSNIFGGSKNRREEHPKSSKNMPELQKMNTLGNNEYSR